MCYLFNNFVWVKKCAVQQCFFLFFGCCYFVCFYSLLSFSWECPLHVMLKRNLLFCLEPLVPKELFEELLQYLAVCHRVLKVGLTVGGDHS